MSDRLAVMLVPALLCSCGVAHHVSTEQPVRLAATRGSLQYLPVYLAQALGYYKEEGVSVSFQEMAGAPKSMQSLLGGTTDVVSGGFTSVVLMNAERRRVQAFSALTRYLAFVGMVSPATKKVINKIEDLDGATVGVSSPGSDQHMILNYLCARHGVNPSHVKAVAIGAGTSEAMALERGIVDVGVGVGTSISLITKRHPKISVLFDLRSPEGLRKHLGVTEFAHSVLYAKSDWMRAHADAARKIARATFRASEWTRRHSAEEIRQHLPDSLLTGDSEVDRDAIASVVQLLSPDDRFKPEHLEAARKNPCSFERARKEWHG